MSGLLAVKTKAGIAGAPIVEFSDVEQLQIYGQMPAVGQLQDSTFTIPTQDANGDPHPALAELTPGRIVQVRDETGSTDIHAMLIEKRNRAIFDAVDPKEQKWTITGRRLQAVLADARWRPTLGYGKAPWGPTRTFSFASPEYVPVGWTACQVLATQRTGTVFYQGLPSKWFDPDAAWICPSVDSATSGHVGHWYTEGIFTVAADTALVVIMGADNRADVFIDGFPLVSVGTYLGFNETHRVTVFVTAGTHKISAKVSNYVDGGDYPPPGMGPLLVGDPTAFICAVYTTDSSGRVGTLVIHTDASWPVLEYPNVPPGMTIGQIAGIGLSEANADGILTYVGKSFDDVYDSNGVAFDPIESVTVPVGGSLLDSAEAWALTYSDFDMPPDSFTWDLYRLGEQGGPTSVEYSAANRNLVHLADDDLDDGTDCLTVSWPGGPPFRYPASGGVKMGDLSVSAGGYPEAVYLAASWLALRASGVITQVTPAIKPRNAGEAPLTGYLLGDTVTVDDGAGPIVDRFVSYVGTWTDNQKWDWGIALRNKHLDDLDALSLWIQRMAPGGAGGLAPSGPAAPPPPFGSNVDSSELTFSVPDPLATGVSGKDDAVSSSGNLFGVLVILKTPCSSGSTDFKYMVDGVDVLGGAGSMGASVKMKFFNVNLGSSQYTQWLEGMKSVLSMEITAVGVAAAGMVVKGVVIQ